MAKAKPKRSREKLVDRLEAARTLGVARASVERLITEGRLKPAGRDGRRHLYRIADIRRLAHELAPVRAVARDVLLADYKAQAADLRDRRRLLLETWLADDAWLPAWAACTRWYEKTSAEWPESLAAQLGKLDADHAALLDASPMPAAPAWKLYEAADVLALLADPRPRWSWLPVASRRLRELAARGKGAWIREDGAGWSPEGDFRLAPSAPGPAVPFVDPLLHGLADYVSRGREWRALDAALAAPEPEPAPPEPADAREAREQWHDARARHREARVTVRRGHRRRAVVVAAIGEALRFAKVAWTSFSAQAPAFAGDEPRALAAATGARVDTIKRMQAVAGGAR